MSEEELKKLEEEDESSDEDGDQDYIKLDGSTSKTNQVFKNLTNELVDIKAKINEFLSRRNQQRNLARETGGLEAEEQKESHEKDVWDDRSEEVDKMGSTDTFNTTGMKSVVWQAKKDRLKAKKHAKEAAKEGAEAGVGVNLLGEKKLTLMEKIKLRQDLSHEKGGEDLWR